MAGPEIRVEGAWLWYPGSREPALRGVSARFTPGRLTVVVGHNGSGKTSLLLVAALLLRPQRGRVLVDGVPAWESGLAGQLRGRIVYVPERPILFRGTVLDNIALGPRLRGLDREEARARALEAARRLGIDGLLHRSARALSRGQASLVTLARALAAEPEALLLDEPLANLDSKRRALVASALAELASQGHTIALASHDRAAAEAAHETLTLEEGRLA